MTIENLTRLTRGVGLTSPWVTSITGFAFEPHKVKQGYAYMCPNSDEEAINEALSNGAYAIIFDKHTKIIDNEIAWIEVDSIDMALVRLMRFVGSQRKLKFVTVSPLQMSILSNIRLGENTKLLDEDTKSSFKDIMNSNEDCYMFSSNQKLLQNIAPLHDSIFTCTNAKTMQGSTLFQSSFVHEESYYKKIPISPIFVPTLCGILSFLNKEKIDFKLEPFKPLENFSPLFIDNSLKVHPFGSREKALIIESSEELFECEISQISKLFPNIKLFTCKPKNSTCKAQTDVVYESYEELKNLDTTLFRYALILGDKEKIIETLNDRASNQPSLF